MLNKVEVVGMLRLTAIPQQGGVHTRGMLCEPEVCVGGVIWNDYSS